MVQLCVVQHDPRECSGEDRISAMQTFPLHTCTLHNYRTGGWLLQCSVVFVGGFVCSCVQYLCICEEDLCWEFVCNCVEYLCAIVVYLCAVEEKQKIESVGAVSSLRAPLPSSLPYFLLFFACQSHKQTQANTNKHKQTQTNTDKHRRKRWNLWAPFPLSSSPPPCS